MNKKFFNEIKDQKNLKTSNKPSFSDELFKSYDTTFWPGTDLKASESLSGVSEKSLIMDSLNHYISDKFEESKEETLAIPGGKLKKIENKTLSEHRCQELDQEKLRQLCDEAIQTGSSSKRYIKNCTPNIDILFISDFFKPNSEIHESMENAFLGDIIPYFFSGDACLLFSNMAKAMGISEDKMAITSPLMSLQENEEKETLELFYQDIAFFNPKMIISLGAKTVKMLLKERKRIADVHGQLFKRDLNIEDRMSTFTIMPLFHPGFLVANPNMKKAAWIDLQKAMKLI